MYTEILSTFSENMCRNRQISIIIIKIEPNLVHCIHAHNIFSFSIIDFRFFYEVYSIH